MNPSGTNIAFGWVGAAVYLCVASVASSKAVVKSAASSSCSSAKLGHVPKRGISMLQAAHKPKDQAGFPLNKATLEVDGDATGHASPKQDRRYHRGKLAVSKTNEDSRPTSGAPVNFFQMHSSSTNGSFQLDEPKDALDNATSSEVIALDESGEDGTDAVSSFEEKSTELAHPLPTQVTGKPESSPLPSPSTETVLSDLPSRLHAGAIASVVLVCVILVLFFWKRWHNPDTITAVGLRAAGVRVTSGPELQNMFSSLSKDKAATTAETVCPGILMRIQGRVVERQPGDVLVAPLSRRPCVIYSASVSHNRSDGVHQPPLAYHSSGVDFAIELLDAPHLSVSVHHHDAALFDMAEGRYACEKEFAEACDQWRNFTWVHLTSGADASQSVANRKDPGFEGKLEFRECALVLGSTVTIVGEVARDPDGGLCMYPWRPPLPLAIARAPWITSPSSWWKRAESFKTAVRDPLVGRVMASDDPKLLC